MSDDDKELLKGNMVDEAIRFLSNPNVAKHSYDRKVQFLRKKGLSDQEIETAFSQATPTMDQFGQGTMAVRMPMPVMAPVITRTPFWIKLRDAGNLVVLLSAASYGIIYIFKTYIQPFLTGRIRKKSLEETIAELHQSVVTVLKEVQKTMVSVEQAIVLQSQHIQTLNTKELSNSFGSNHQIEELKMEINSLKSLLLTRRAFPTTPMPSIPQWQRSQVMEITPGNGETCSPARNMVPVTHSGTEIAQDGHEECNTNLEHANGKLGSELCNGSQVFVNSDETIE